MNSDLVAYYKDRAQEYEKIYLKPERQTDLKKAAILLQSIFEQKSVLEIACGTGYWTEKIAIVAKNIVATDINAAVIAIAREKEYPNANVVFQVADFYNFVDDQKFETLFGGFIWSHIPLQDLNHFLTTVHEKVEKGGTVVFMDNIYVEKSNHPITFVDELGNTFQTRHLEDGSPHLVLKNFPTVDFLKAQLKEFAKDIEFVTLDYFWVLTYKIL
jgi:ubiquinone/menaquinone biosynthesis C-methylase UbiE